LVLFGFNDLTQDPHISAFFFGFVFVMLMWQRGYDFDNQRFAVFDLD